MAEPHRNSTGRWRRRMRASLRRAAILIALAVAVSWLVAVGLAYTVEPRRGAMAQWQAWSPPGVLTTTTAWERVGAHYVERVRGVGQKRAWGPEQAVGMPDTPTQGDIQTAWAGRSPDAKGEWLRLRWDRPVLCTELRVYQSYNPGAIVSIAASAGGGAEHVVWSASLAAAGEGSQPVLQIRVDPARAIDSVVLHMDTTLVPGWNEIDAVLLRDGRDTLHAAGDAEASSSYADRGARGAAPAWCRFERLSGVKEPDFAAAGVFGWPRPAWVAERRVGAIGPGYSASGPMQAVPYRPVLDALAVNAAVYAVALGVAGAALLWPLRPLRRMVRMQRGHCPSCGHDLRFAFAEGCGECGFLRRGDDGA